LSEKGLSGFDLILMFLVEVQLLGESGVEEGGLLLVVELLATGAGLVLAGHPFRGHRQHGHDVALQRVLLHDPVEKF
jgi:hypothetical protein